MLVANFQNVAHRYGAYQVLRDVSVTISAGQKVGLVGPNGAGKTAMLRLLLGQEAPESGTVHIPKHVCVGYVPQYVEFRDEYSVWDCLSADYQRIAGRLRDEERRLAQASSDDMEHALRGYQQARDDYDRIEGDAFPQRAQNMLEALGLHDRMAQPVGSLSGGEKNVVSLAGALLQEPDLLILDEPGNHLDYEGIAWLEDFINRFKGAVLIVSHNRYLLDRVVKGILHLEDGRVTYYDGGYSAYRATRLRNLLAQQSDYIANQKRLKQLEELVKRFEQIARSRRSDPAWGKRLRARRSQLEREKKNAVEKPVLGPDRIRADFATQASHALQLARLMVLKPNFLILDEPTNHLDIPASEAIEEALEEYEGTLLVVSHDRYFLDKIVNRVVEAQDHELVSYPGNFSEFWHARKAERTTVVGRVSKRGQQREKAKKQHLPDDAVTLERRIQEAEREKEKVESRLADAFNDRDRREGRRLQKRLDQLNTLIDSLYEKWMSVG